MPFQSTWSTETAAAYAALKAELAKYPVLPIG
jgi:hypothetical protein